MRLGVGISESLKFREELSVLMTSNEEETVPVPLPLLLIMLGMEVVI